MALPVLAVLAPLDARAQERPTAGLDVAARRGAAVVEDRAVAPGAGGDLAPAAVDGDGPALAVVERVEGLEAFSLLGISWPAGGDVHAVVRLALPDGSWTAWQDVAHGGAGAEPDQPTEATDGGDTTDATDGGEAAAAPARHASEPVWAGAATGYELAVEGGAPEGLAVHLVRLEATAEPLPEGPAEGDEAALAAAAIPAWTEPPLSSGLVGPPPVIGRGGWAARPAPLGWDATDDVELAVVHHTADVAPYGYAAEDVPAILRAIQAYHLDGLGWYDIGYNFVVDRFGRIWEAREGGVSKAVIGAHAAGFNTGSVGVAVLGNFTGVGGNDAIVGALSSVIAWKLFLSGSDPATTARLWVRTTDRYAAGTIASLPRIVGHGDLNATGCPAGLAELLDVVRADVVNRYAAMVGGSGITPAPGPTAPTGATPHPGDFNGDGRTDVLWHRADSDRKVLWYGQSNGTFAPQERTFRVGFAPVLGDFDGDGTTDVYWWAGQREGDTIWLGQHSGELRLRNQPYSGSGRPTVYDGDADGDDDLVWYDATTGAVQLWTSQGVNGFRSRNERAQPGASPIVLDLDGDTQDDLLWYRSGQAAHDVWVATGRMAFSVAVAGLPPDQAATTGDFDGDGTEDLLLTGPAGTTIWWRGFLDASTLPAAGDLRAATADMTGGGRDDIVLLRADGLVLQFYGSPDRALPSVQRAAAPGWHPVVGDVNGDARDDLLWVGPDGSTELWTAS